MPTFPDRTVEAIIFDWDGTAVPDRIADAGAARSRVEALSQAGVDFAVVSGTSGPISSLASGLG